ncbi:hypothetical protein F4808DRAFT_461816 [Astrocystis sublimbata]|nr:hypothetical protein F4808DRAFT_461816 [Astrocystis sublimbata]
MAEVAVEDESRESIGPQPARSSEAPDEHLESPAPSLVHQYNDNDVDSEDDNFDSDVDSSLEAHKEREAKRVLITANNRRAKSKFAEATKEAEAKFYRENGVVYTNDESWAKLRAYPLNAHLYVSSSVPRIPTPQGKATCGEGTASNVELTHLHEEGENLVAIDIPAGVLPMRIRFINELLLADFSRNCAMAGLLVLNEDHVAPFKSLIPFEQEIRKRHRHLEADFDNISREKPFHPAVSRDVPYLPWTLSYYLHRQFDKTSPEDDTDRARALLDGYRAFIHVLNTDLKSLVDDYRRIVSRTVERLPFSHLWYLFPSGEEIVVKYPRYQVFRVLTVSGGRRALPGSGEQRVASFRGVSDLVIDCFYIDYDGDKFGPVPFTLRIKPYDDVRRVSNLSVYPLSYETNSPGNKPLHEYLMTRGEKFVELTTVSHRSYRGLTVKEPGLFETVDKIESDVVVDFELAFRLNTRLKPIFGNGVIIEPTPELPNETVDDYHISYDDAEFLVSRWCKWNRETDFLHAYSPGRLSDGHFILLPSRVYAYVLLDRKWCPLDIDLIVTVHKVTPGEHDGFQKLVLPSGHRKIVRALINTHADKFETTESQHEFDIVKGKGRGLIILLHGAPGVGKTSTAECVAANAGRPLFPITCGDIGGETAQEVERNLESFFALARKWNCVLLLDEADVFLSSRQSGNIVQNSLVSVFLRVLEYYPGILILTTNRVGSFDEAIKSRVHCALYYPMLNEKRTFLVWQKNIDKLEEQNEKVDPAVRVQFERKDIEKFAKRHWKEGNRDNRWNGRQIKNAFQTAVSLAQWDCYQALSEIKGPVSPVLKAKHFKKVALASKHFDKYLTKTRRSDEAIAKELGIRIDNSSEEDSGSVSDSSSSEEKSDDGQSFKKSDKKKARSKASGSMKKSKSRSHGKSKRSKSPTESSESQSSETSDSEVNVSDDSNTDGESRQKHRDSKRKQEKRQ